MKYLIFSSIVLTYLTGCTSQTQPVNNSAKPSDTIVTSGTTVTNPVVSS